MRKSIFITGGGSGIGRATAQYFAQKGWFVGLADIDQTGLAATAAMLPDGASATFTMDVREADAWREALANFVGKAGRLDVMFNNAGVPAGGPIGESDAVGIARTVDINLTGVLLGASAAYPHLKATPGSVLVSTCSAAGIYAGPGMSVYSATKYGVRGMTESLDREWSDEGIRARTIMPSFIDTPLLDHTRTGSNESIRETVRAAGLEFTPVEQVAQAVWDAVHGKKVHTVVGKTARKLAFAARWAPWLLPKGFTADR